MRMWLATTAALALAAAMAATPAAAAITLTFKIDVTSVNDQSDFVPFSFQETWTWDRSYTRTVISGVDTRQLLGPATVDGPSPVTDNQAAFAGVDLANPDDVDSRLHYIVPNTLSFGLRTQASSSQVIFEGEKGSADDVVREGLYLRGISLGIFGTETIGDLDLTDVNEVRAFLAGRDLTWSEFAGFRLVTEDSPPFVAYENRTYLGTARLVTDAPGAVAVPEPDAWGLMIAGFGGVGWALRRRTRLAAAAA